MECTGFHPDFMPSLRNLTIHCGPSDSVFAAKKMDKFLWGIVNLMKSQEQNTSSTSHLSPPEWLSHVYLQQQNSFEGTASGDVPKNMRLQNLYLETNWLSKSFYDNASGLARELLDNVCNNIFVCSNKKSHKLSLYRQGISFHE